MIIIGTSDKMAHIMQIMFALDITMLLVFIACLIGLVILWRVITLEPNEKETCDHLFRPHYDGLEETPSGQKCILCAKYNSLEDVLTGRG